MKTIVFSDNPSETFNIMAEDDRFMVCSRVYTAIESKEEATKWDKGRLAHLDAEFEAQQVFSDRDEWEWSDHCAECSSDYHYDNGERPVEYDKDTQCYTIVDIQEKIRGADNYYTRFNYLDKTECEEALEYLHLGQDMYQQDSFGIGRNRVPLGDYTIA